MTALAVPYHHDGGTALAAWTYACDPDEPGGWGVHRHAEHQLMWTATGSVRAVAAGRSWVLPPSRALFVPGGAAHDVGAPGPSAMHFLYAQPGSCPLTWTAPTVVRVTPLLRELLVSLGASRGSHPLADQALAVVWHELADAVATDDGVTWPDDPRAAVVADRLVQVPADDTPLADWAARLRVGESTLRRAFVTDTGVTFTEWRSRARLQAALPLLERGVPVSAVAGRVGYASVNGFGAAFRKRYGTSPGAWRSQLS